MPDNGSARHAPMRGDVKRCSTEHVAPKERLAFWSDTLTAGLSRRTRINFECADTKEFHSAVETADLDSVSILRLTGVAHRAVRAAVHNSSEGPRTFSIIVSRRSPWTLTHRTPLSMDRGDAVLIDSTLGVDARFLSSYDVSHLKLSESWLRQWVPFPGALVGRRLAAHGGWGGALASFVSQLSPDAASTSSVPLALMVDHIGALLALAAAEISPLSFKDKPNTADLHTRVLDTIRQRCTEAELTAQEVAAAVGVSPRTVHRVLGRFDQTFGALLIAARIEVALSLLKSSRHRSLTIAEIGHRAGFSDPSHFSRTMRASLGRTPGQIAATFSS